MDAIEKKGTGQNAASYISWATAWAAVAERFPDAEYGVKLFGDNQLPYTFDPVTGYMVHTYVTINGITRTMWLPVMDFRNNAMKSEEYKAGNNNVQSATMTDINKAIMRCLVKNIAMFGLGLSCFIGDEEPYVTNIGNDVKFVDKDDVLAIRGIMKEMGWKDENTIAKRFNVPSIDKMTTTDLENFKLMVANEKKKRENAANKVQDIDDTDVLPESAEPVAS